MLEPYSGATIKAIDKSQKLTYLFDIIKNVGIKSFNLVFFNFCKKSKTSWLRFLKLHFRTLGNILNQSKKFKLQSISEDILSKFIFAR